MFFLRNKKDYQIKENLNQLGFLSIDNQLYSFKYATLKCRYLNTLKIKILLLMMLFNSIIFFYPFILFKL